MEKPTGEEPRIEKYNEALRKELERGLSGLEKGFIHSYSLIRIFEEAGKTKFISDLVKIDIDDVLERFRPSLKYERFIEMCGVVGHYGMHTARLYEKNKSKIAETEDTLHERGRALENVRNVYYGDSLKDAIDYYEDIGLAEQAQKAKKARFSMAVGTAENLQEAIDIGAIESDTTKEQFKSMQLEYEKLREQLIREEVERLCDLYAKPMLDLDKRNNIAAAIKNELQVMLDEIS